MQLTRRILDLKQVSIIKEQTQGCINKAFDKNILHAKRHSLGKKYIHISICLWFILQFCRGFPGLYLWLTVICLSGCMVKTAEVIVGLCSTVSLQDEQLYRNLHEEINHLALKLEKQGKTDGKNISSKRKHINKMYTVSLKLRLKMYAA